MLIADENPCAHRENETGVMLYLNPSRGSTIFIVQCHHLDIYSIRNGVYETCHAHADSAGGPTTSQTGWSALNTLNYTSAT
jgi:hypothetical protein